MPIKRNAAKAHKSFINRNGVILSRFYSAINPLIQQRMKANIPLEEGDFYLSEEGYRVFTVQYHLKRGYCCESGCRHCPYGYDAKSGRQ